MKKIVFAGLMMLFGCVILGGCSIEETNRSKVEDIDYTVVADEDLPETLIEEIDSIGDEEIKLSFSDGEYLYLVRSYGVQPAGSSIQVLSLYRTKNAIVFDTKLLGNEEGQTQDEHTSNPYIVVKLQGEEQNVVFE